MVRGTVRIPPLKPYPVTKDSGRLWLGEVPAHWGMRKLRGILHMVTERNRPDLPLLSVVRERGVIQRDTTAQDENRNFIPDDLGNYKVVRVGQFAMNKMKAWQGSYGVSQYEGIVSPAYFVFDLAAVEGLFFHTAIRSRAYVPSFTQASDGVRIGQWDLAEPRMREIVFAIPPLPEQTAIVRFLDYVDRRIRRYIRAKQKLIALLEEQKQTIIHRAVTGQIDVRTGKPYPAYRPSGVEWLGDVPEHWEVVPSRAVFKHRNEKAREDEETLTASQAHGVVSRSDFMAREGRRVMQVITGRDILKHVEPNDFVMSMRSFEGGLEWSRIRGAISSAYVMLVPTEDVHPPYYARLLKTSAYISALRRTSDLVRDGQALRYANFVQIPLPRVPLQEQVAIATFLDTAAADITSRICRMERETDLLREYRPRLIADVVTGKLDVREAAAQLPAEVGEDEQGPLDGAEATPEGLSEGDVAEGISVGEESAT